MEPGATMELRGGRGSELEVEDTPYIVVEKIQPLSTCSARDTRYYRKAGESRPGKGADEINYIRAYFR